MNADEFAAWVEASSWRVAKTMPDVPHEYTIISWGDWDSFIAAAEFIRANGYPAVWRHHRPKPYWELEGRIYWAFQTVINRCILGNPATDVRRVMETELPESRGLTSRSLVDSEQASQADRHTVGERLLDNYGVTEQNWRDALGKTPGFAISESPTYVARGLAALAQDPDVAQFAGQVLTPRQLADRYAVTDADGSRPDAWGYIAAHGMEEQSGKNVERFR